MCHVYNYSFEFKIVMHCTVSQDIGTPRTCSLKSSPYHAHGRSDRKHSTGVKFFNKCDRSHEENMCYDINYANELWSWNMCAFLMLNRSKITFNNLISHTLKKYSPAENFPLLSHHFEHVSTAMSRRYMSPYINTTRLNALQWTIIP